MDFAIYNAEKYCGDTMGEIEKVNEEIINSTELRIQSALSITDEHTEYSEVLINSYRGIKGVENILNYVYDNNEEFDFDMRVFEKLLRYISMNPKYRYYESIGFNLCGKTIARLDLIPKMKNILDKYDVETNMLVVEINENSHFEKNSDIIRENIKRLRKLGFRIALDDFGTAKASLKVLMDYDFDIIKIDKSFLQGDFEKEFSSSREILKCIANVIRMRKQQSIFEGVETKEQLQIVKSLGYDSIQGYVYEKPHVMK